jgi:acyl-CoA reductase-like NAD-dependent aldehyde dehydrogenase
MTIPAPLGIVAGITVTVVAVLLFGLEIYKSQAMLGDYDNTRDDADKAVRAADRHAEAIAWHDEQITKLRREITAAMLDHAEQLDELWQRPAAIPEPRDDGDAITAPINTVESHAALNHWSKSLTDKPTPYRRDIPFKDWLT